LSKNKAEKLTDKEKEQQRLIIPFEKAKQFITNLNAILDTEIFRDWEINQSSIILKSTHLKMSFTLKNTAIEKILEAMDKSQKRIGEFLDPDRVPDEELEAEVEE